MNFEPAETTEPPGHKPLVVNVVVVGPFEEEEERTSIASDVVKVGLGIFHIMSPKGFPQESAD